MIAGKASAMVQDVPQHSLLQTTVLHLLPGALTTVVYVILAPTVMGLGFPALLGILLAALLIAVPFELGYLLRQAKQATGNANLRAVVPYRERVSAWWYVVVTIGMVIWGLLVTGFTPLDDLLRQTVFAWLPDWYLTFGLDQVDQYSRTALIATFAFRFLTDGIIFPVVEELYFRGYLLPRLSRQGRWAPALNALLFSLYHFWTPWANPSRILLMLPLVYIVWWKRNVYLSIIAHCTLNIVGGLLTAGLILSS